MIVDIHQHITSARFPQFAETLGNGRGSFTARQLLKDMDKWGIDRSVVLPLSNPENADMFGAAGNREVVEACAKHPDRLTPFCNIDPREGKNNPRFDLSSIMRIYKDLGCKGVGEVCASLPVTNPLYKNLFHHAGQEELPVLFHLSPKRAGLYGMIDKPGLPGLEEVLKEFPDTIFIGHAPSFWNEMDGNLRPSQRDHYPGGPILKDGPLWRLMENYPNLHGDFSAGSGNNALTRDPAAGIRFIRRFHKQLFYGTDCFYVSYQPPPQLTMMQNLLREKTVTNAMYENIMHRNFERVFRI